MKKKRQDRRWKTREDQREDLKREEARIVFFFKITGPSNNFEFSKLPLPTLKAF